MEVRGALPVSPSPTTERHIQGRHVELVSAGRRLWNLEEFA